METILPGLNIHDAGRIFTLVGKFRSRGYSVRTSRLFRIEIELYNEMLGGYLHRLVEFIHSEHKYISGQ